MLMRVCAWLSTPAHAFHSPARVSMPQEGLGPSCLSKTAEQRGREPRACPAPQPHLWRALAEAWPALAVSTDAPRGEAVRPWGSLCGRGLEAAGWLLQH